MKAAIYARVSTSEQTKGYSLPTQVRGCQAYAEQHGLTVIATIQDDVSGATRLDEREGGRQLLGLIEGGEVGAVIVWRLDRLSRPPEDELSRMLTIVEHMQRHGVTVHDCEGGPVRGDMASIMIAFFKGIAASQERAAIRERSMRGRKAKAEAGKWVGQGFPPFGYIKVGRGKDARVEIEPDDAATVRQIFNWYIGKDGPPMALYSIAQRLMAEGIKTPGHWYKDGSANWCYSHIGRRILRRRVYLGEFTYKDVVINMPELAIIDEATWQAAQLRLDKAKERPRPKTALRVYLLGGRRLTCTCGGHMGGFTTRVSVSYGYRLHSYYRCKRAERYANTGDCLEQALRVDDIDNLVWDWLVNVISDDKRLDEVLSKMIEEAATELEPTKVELGRVDELMGKASRKVERLMAAFGESDNPAIAKALQARIEEAAQLRQALERQRAALVAKIANAEIGPDYRDEVMAIARQARGRLREGGTAEDRRYLVEALDVRASLYHREGRKMLRLSCGLRAAQDDICLDDTPLQKKATIDKRPAFVIEDDVQLS